MEVGRLICLITTSIADIKVSILPRMQFKLTHLIVDSGGRFTAKCSSPFLSFHSKNLKPQEILLTTTYEVTEPS